MGLISVIFSVVLLAFNFVANKHYQTKAGVSVKAGLLFNATNGFFAAIIMLLLNLCINGAFLKITSISLLFAFGVAFCNILYVLLGFYMMKSGSLAIYTMFLMSGGMIVPYLWGVFKLNEEISIYRILGLVIMILGVIVSNAKKQKTAVKYVLIGFLVFILNGAVSTFSKMHQIESTYATVSKTEFVVLCNVMKFLFCLIVILFLNSKKEMASTYIPFKKLVGIILLSSVLDSSSYYLQLFGAEKLPATVLYPLITGGSIILTAMFGIILYKEKINKQTFTGMTLCFIATLLFL